ncbi:MAG: ATP-binding protein [Candidatus Aenigmarchaeota archaeon]|nr:ATP-binding protein [Candidatus Aenigmarchaeota archaeon]
MQPSAIVGKLISGNFSEITVRQKQGESIEIGGLFVADNEGDEHYIMECFNLVYGSQMGDMTKESMAGMSLAGFNDMVIFDKALSNYTLARLRPILHVKDGKASAPKSLPEFFSDIRPIRESDFTFVMNSMGINLGKIRSGTHVLEISSIIPTKALTHHILVAATTGRGKSNLVKVISASVVDDDSIGMLVLDPHDEYYGRNGVGIGSSENCIYYSINPPRNARSLVINTKTLHPSHIEMTMTDAQSQALGFYYSKYDENWVEQLMCGPADMHDEIKEATVYALRRKFEVMLGLRNSNGELKADGLFSTSSGLTTIQDICTELEKGKTVVIDTSLISGEIEILIGSMIAKEMLYKYKKYKMEGKLSGKPMISIVIEEAPRVLNAEAMQRNNIFSTIAREGRKFQIGLIAITQLPSLIPKEILANINTKIILGTELAAERNALIESASQDLSQSSRAIASLDVGEAIVSSNFTKFAMPIKIPEFTGMANTSGKKGFSGL